MEEIVRLTADLIRFQTTRSRPQEIHRCADFIEEYLKRHKIAYRRLHHGTTPSLLVTPQEGRAPVLLLSHFDVVEGADELFRPVEQDGNLYGRGALDDKYAVALSLVLLKNCLERLREKGMSQKDLPFGILLTGDEEVGGSDGAYRGLSMVDTEFCIVLDGGSVNEIITHEKGVLFLKLVSHGRSAHGSRPWLGENAAEKLIRDYLRLKTFFKQTDHEIWYRTITLSGLHAGGSINQVPDYAEATLDIRFTEQDNAELLLAEMRGVIDGQIEVLLNEPMFIAGSSKYLDLLLEIAPEASTCVEHGSSDARYLSLYHIHGIVWGAEGDDSHHSPTEHVTISSIELLYERLFRFVTRIAKVQ